MRVKYKRVYEPYILYLVYWTIIHFLMRENTANDSVIIYMGAVKKYGLIGFMKMRYETWTSRVLIDGLIGLFADNKFLFCFVDTAMLLLLVWSIRVILNCGDDLWMNYMIVFAIIAYPFQDMSSAGWMATIGNYMWPMAAVLYAMSGIARSLRGERIPLWSYPLYIIAMIYGTNMEQVAVYCFGFSVMITVYLLIKNHRVYFLPIAMILSSLGEILFAVTCIGSKTRLEDEIRSWNPDFEMYGVMDKLNIGINNTIQQIFSFDTIFMMSSMVLLLLCVSIWKNSYIGTVGVIPCMLLALCNRLQTDKSDNYFLKTETLFAPSETTFADRKSYILFVVLWIMLTCILLEVVVASKSFADIHLLTLLLGLGLATHVLMGFSPTVYVSSRRTMIFLEFSMIFILLFLLNRNIELLKDNKLLRLAIGTVMGAGAALGAINGLIIVLIVQ